MNDFNIKNLTKIPIRWGPEIEDGSRIVDVKKRICKTIFFILLTMMTLPFQSFAQGNVTLNILNNQPDNCCGGDAGVYTPNGTENGKTKYTKPNKQVIWTGTEWHVQCDDPLIAGINWNTLWFNTNDTPKAPDVEWQASFGCFLIDFSGDTSPVGPQCSITINSVSKTDESCNGADDGTITIDASCTNCSGTLEYVVGGTIYSSSPITGLADGSYTIVAQASGDNACNDSGTTQMIAAGSTAPTWYADTDSDGFGDAASSQDDCTQPAGYVDNSTDCNDNDAAVNDMNAAPMVIGNTCYSSMANALTDAVSGDNIEISTSLSEAGPITVPMGVTVTVASGVAVTVTAGDFINNGTLTGEGSIDFSDSSNSLINNGTSSLTGGTNGTLNNSGTLVL